MAIGEAGRPPRHPSIENARTLGRLRHLKRTNASLRFLSLEPLLGPLGGLDLAGVHWVIAGGESGPGARPVRAEWLRSIRDACHAQTVAFFFKQWGGRSPKSGGNELDGRQWLEYPSTADLDRLGASTAVADAAPVDRSSGEGHGGWTLGPGEADWMGRSPA